jgi:glutathione S-transferase
VLVEDGKVITESNIIIQYLEEICPEPRMMPEDPVDRARVRHWLLKLDTNAHMDVAALTFGIALRYRILERFPTRERLDAFLEAIPNQSRRSFYADILLNGTDSPLFGRAICAYAQLIAEMEAALQKHDWLVGPAMTLADAAYVAYALRLESLQLHGLWDGRPQFQGWLERLKTTRGFREGITPYRSEDLMSIMTMKGEEGWPQVERILRQTCREEIAA